METTRHEVAAQWADELFGFPNFLRFWFPEKQFVGAKRDQSWMSATRKDNGGLYGMAIGEGAQLNPDWSHFSISRRADQGLINPDLFKEDGEWDAFVIRTKNYADLPILENLKSDLEIVDSFLAENFPDASTKADSDEVISWAALRNDDDKVVGIGALTVWESGELAAQSIAIANDQRGKGYGRELVERMVSTAHSLGFETMCLGVWFHNTVAKSLYQSMGFIPVDSFLHYSRVEATERGRNTPSA
jgi:ribosomal protein S18 acetylase RimI-like enzyme